VSFDPVFDRAWTHLLVSRDGPLATLRLHRPDARNSLNGELISELTEAARALRLRSDILTVILTGDDDNFSAGADLGAISAGGRSPTLLEAREAVMAGPDMCRAWTEIEAVTIAAIEGYCIGGACALAIACDFRILGEGAYLRLPEVPLGINMSWRSLPQITALVGPARAKRFVMFGAAADAETCLSWGFADELAPRGGSMSVARAWAERIAGLPPVPVRMTKEAINAVSSANHHASIYMDRDQYLLTTKTADFSEGVAAFFQKRKPVFRGD
jgi:enoyl-CoA hydratase/carnithine racemase